MELIGEMLREMLSRGEVMLALPPDFAEQINHRCFAMLRQIRQIAADETLDDPECFQRIEQIVCVLEENGIDCGTRHDFG